MAPHISKTKESVKPKTLRSEHLILVRKSLGLEESLPVSQMVCAVVLVAKLVGVLVAKFVVVLVGCFYLWFLSQ